MSNSGLVLPGQAIAPSNNQAIGSAVHIHGSHLCASIAGLVETTQPKGAKTPTLSITRTSGALLPEVGTTVLGKITRTGPKQANLSILALGSAGEHVCPDAFPALVRQQDIRATEIDKVKVAESFRVGDVVRAVVISVGDERNYYLSTARNEFGVILATSESGNAMYPISWREFQDPETGAREVRKVAKPV